MRDIVTFKQEIIADLLFADFVKHKASYHATFSFLNYTLVLYREDGWWRNQIFNIRVAL